MKNERHSENQEQAGSPEQQGAEHLPKVKLQVSHRDLCLDPKELFFLVLAFNTSLLFFPPKKQLAALLKFNQISHLCSFNDYSEK